MRSDGGKAAPRRRSASGAGGLALPGRVFPGLAISGLLVPGLLYTLAAEAAAAVPAHPAEVAVTADLTRATSETPSRTLPQVLAQATSQPDPGNAPPSTPPTPPEASFDIPAQALDLALEQFSGQAGHPVLFADTVVAGLGSTAVAGRMAPRAALERLLAGTGLAITAERGGVFTVGRRPTPASDLGSGRDQALAPVTVAASRVVGVQTEQGASYATPRIAHGKGIDLHETPQTVSVLTRRLIEDQNIESISEAMDHVTGITVGHDYYGQPTNFYSRGFAINHVQLDGSSLGAANSEYYMPNLAMYDHVEILRGADGLFAGAGDPGGTINLVRKRALAQPQLKASLAAGSWDRYRAEVDVTGPLAFEGRLRGRAVASLKRQRAFYETAFHHDDFFFGTLEADLTPSTVVSIGASHDKVNENPMYFGLPRRNDGSDLGLRRSRNTAASWNRWPKQTEEYFARLEQDLPGAWRLVAQATTTDYKASVRALSSWGGADADGLLGRRMDAYDFASRRHALDVHVDGSFSLWGRDHRLVVGADSQYVRNRSSLYSLLWGDAVPFNEAMRGGVSIDDHDFAATAAFTSERLTGRYPRTTRQKAAYGRLQLKLADPLTAIVGARWASYDSESQSLNYNAAGALATHTRSFYDESGIVTPYFGLVHELDPRWMVYASVSEIYRSQADRLAGPPGNPSPLDPVRGRNYELGTKGRLLDGRLDVALAVYRIARSGEAVADPAYDSATLGEGRLSCCALNNGLVVSKGFDAEIRGELSPGWEVLAGYTYNRNEDRERRGIYSTITPRHLLKVWTTWQLPGGGRNWTVGGGVIAQSAETLIGRIRASNPETWSWEGSNTPFFYRQGGYAVWSASAGYRIDRHWTASLLVGNLFDRRYYASLGDLDRGNFYGEPRNAMLTLRGSF